MRCGLALALVAMRLGATLLAGLWRDFVWQLTAVLGGAPGPVGVAAHGSGPSRHGWPVAEGDVGGGGDRRDGEGSHVALLRAIVPLRIALWNSQALLVGVVEPQRPHVGEAS